MDHRVAAGEQRTNGGGVGDITDDVVDGGQAMQRFDPAQLVGVAHESPGLVAGRDEATQDVSSGEPGRTCHGYSHGRTLGRTGI